MNKICIIVWGIMMGIVDHQLDARFVYLYSHGIAATRHDVRQFLRHYKKVNGIVCYDASNERYTITKPFISFDYHDSWYWTPGNEWFLKQRQLLRRLVRGNYQHAALAQNADIVQLKKAYLAHKNDSDQFILYGLSRGGSNIIAFLGKERPDCIAAAVIESPYAAVKDIVAHVIKRLRLQSFVSIDTGLSLISKIFKKYHKDGSRPIDWIEHIDGDIPILIICSTSDVLVPWTSSYHIYVKLRQAGNRKVHIVILNSGCHGELIQGMDGDKYERVVHAFYKMYGLPHDPMLALHGEADLATSQPPIDDNC